ncbi:MAG: hypothetical protein ACTS82_01095 [Arsenophonus sp. ET-DL12-MAG3]
MAFDLLELRAKAEDRDELEELAHWWRKFKESNNNV